MDHMVRETASNRKYIQDTLRPLQEGNGLRLDITPPPNLLHMIGLVRRTVFNIVPPLPVHDNLLTTANELIFLKYAAFLDYIAYALNTQPDYQLYRTIIDLLTSRD
jgi:hypothetical protein